MKVQFLKTISFNGRLYRKGDKVEVSDKEAGALSKYTFAEEEKAVKPKQPARARNKAVARPPKAAVMEPVETPVQVPEAPVQDAPEEVETKAEESSEAQTPEVTN